MTPPKRRHRRRIEPENRTAAFPKVDATKADALEAWLDQVVASYGVPPMDAAAFRTGARLKHRKSDTLLEDAMIAATAIVHRLKVATRNDRDFEALGVALVNPFEYDGSR